MFTCFNKVTKFSGKSSFVRWETFNCKRVEIPQTTCSNHARHYLDMSLLIINFPKAYTCNCNDTISIYLFF